MRTSRNNWARFTLRRLLPGALLSLCGAAGHAAVSGDWPVHGGTDLEQHFSGLPDINERNVGRLGLAWSFVLDTRRGQEATPIVVGNTLYVSTAWSKVVALNATTGKVIWKFDPAVPGGKGVHACCDVVNRGVAVARGRVFVATIDGRLIALDAATGRTAWSVRTFDPQGSVYQHGCAAHRERYRGHRQRRL